MIQFSASPSRRLRCSSSIASAPDAAALHVAIIQKLVGPLRCAHRRILAVLVDQQCEGWSRVGLRLNILVERAQV
jgi:hypothetical protein